METGRRYRLNLHPQHYDDDFHPHEPLLDSAWYRDLIDESESDEDWWPLSDLLVILKISFFSPFNNCLGYFFDVFFI